MEEEAPPPGGAGSGRVKKPRKRSTADSSPSILKSPKLSASASGRSIGLLTYDAAYGECEVAAIISTEEGRGIGRALMDAARDHAAAAGYHRLWLITTNDNTRAFRFYQLWGMDLCAFYRHAARRSRKVKPSLPEQGADGIPLDHELEFELLLGVTVRPTVSVREGTQPRPKLL